MQLAIWVSLALAGVQILKVNITKDGRLHSALVFLQWGQELEYGYLVEQIVYLNPISMSL